MAWVFRPWLNLDSQKQLSPTIYNVNPLYFFEIGMFQMEQIYQTKAESQQIVATKTTLLLTIPRFNIQVVCKGFIHSCWLEHATTATFHCL